MMKYVNASVLTATGKTIYPQDGSKFADENPGLNAKGTVVERIEGDRAKVSFGPAGYARRNDPSVTVEVDLKDYITEVPWRILVNGIVCDVIDCDYGVSLTVMKEGVEEKTPFTSETLL